MKLFIYTLCIWVMSGITFDYFSKENNENHCKAAGWRFIEETLPDVDNKISMHLQSKIATFCVTDLTDYEKKYGLRK